MKLLILFAAASVAAANQVGPTSKVLCYYDSKSYTRDSQARMLPTDLEPALSFCTHLLYGYAGVQPDTYKVVPLNENLDIGSTHNNYRAITSFKAKYPGLKVLLSIGGDADNEDSGKYNAVLESQTARTALVNSGVLLAEQYGFDGIDLAWQFPRIKPKKIRSSFGSFWHSVKKTFGTTPVDEKESEHREAFTALVREMRAALNLKPNMQLAVTVLPNVNASVYFDVPAIINMVDVVNLHTFDFQTPDRNPKEADYTGPIEAPQNRNPLLNIRQSVDYWVRSGAPKNKIVVGIPTFARTWKLTAESGLTGVPPLAAEGPGDAGPYTKKEGTLSYPEVCKMLIEPVHQKGLRPNLRKVTERKVWGTYGYRLPDDNGEGGIWVSYDDPDSATEKANFVKSNQLGGISISDLSMDDFRGLCTSDKFPILRRAKYVL